MFGKRELMAMRLLFAIASAMLAAMSCFQQQSPVCRALAGQSIRPNENQVIIKNDKNTSDFAILEIVSGGMEISFNGILNKKENNKEKGKNKTKEKEEKNFSIKENIKNSFKNNEKYFFIEGSVKENIENGFYFLETWRSHPKNLIAAIKWSLRFDGKSSLSAIERLFLLQAALQQKKNAFRPGAHDKLRIIDEKENTEEKEKSEKQEYNSDIRIEIINASGKEGAEKMAAKYLQSRGYAAYTVPGMFLKQKDSEIYSYGSEKTAKRIKEFICPSCPIKKSEKKKGLDASIVIGQSFDFSIFMKKEESGEKNISAKKEDKNHSANKKNISANKKKNKNYSKISSAGK